MTAMSSDHELVSAYVREHSENAFRALVARHVDLVHATAMRQVGDSGLAEEITQNVFVILARKAPRLGGVETLAGWLHRTTVLEARARVRAELRRRRREDVAAEISRLERHGDSPLDPLLPLLDEALLHLRESERLALVLRFMEERSLREVGQVLGVAEDAARKRVSRALEQVTEFFRRRGLAVVAAGGASALLVSSAHAAPVGLAASAAQAGLTASSTGSFSLFLCKLMSLTKTQTAAACLVVAAMPLAWQWRAEAHVRQEQAVLSARLAAVKQDAANSEQDIRRTREALTQAQLDTVNAEAQRDGLRAQLAGRLPRPVYQWSDNSPYVRVPKSLLRDMDIAAVANRRGELSEQMKDALQMTGAEAQQAQAAIDRFMAAFQAAQAAGVQPVKPTAADLQGHTPEDTRVFAFPDVTEQLKPLRAELFATLNDTLGPDRLELLRRQLGNWMPVDDEFNGLSSAMGVLPFAHVERFHPASPGIAWLDWSLSKPSGDSMSGTINVDDIPLFLRPALQDWMDRAHQQAELK